MAARQHSRREPEPRRHYSEEEDSDAEAEEASEEEDSGPRGGHGADESDDSEAEKRRTAKPVAGATPRHRWAHRDPRPPSHELRASANARKIYAVKNISGQMVSQQIRFLRSRAPPVVLTSTFCDCSMLPSNGRRRHLNPLHTIDAAFQAPKNFVLVRCP